MVGLLVGNSVGKPNHRFLIVHDLVRHKGDRSSSFDISDDQLDGFLSHTSDQLKQKAVGALSDIFTLTVDDGFSSSMAIADLVEKYNQRAAFFISTAFIGNAGYLDENDIAELASRGHEIGGHGHLHVALDKMPAPHCADDVSRCFETLANLLGYEPESFALPFGRVSKTAMNCLANSGFKNILCSLQGKSVDLATYGLIRRNCLHAHDNEESYASILDGRNDWKGSTFAQAIRKLVGRNSIL